MPAGRSVGVDARRQIEHTDAGDGAVADARTSPLPTADYRPAPDERRTPEATDARRTAAPALRAPAAAAPALLVGPFTAPAGTWTALLDREQATAAHQSACGPLLVTGPVGSGTTAVGLHRAIHLARATPGRVLLTALHPTVLAVLRRRLADLAPDAADRIDCVGVHTLALALLRERRVPVALHGPRVAEAADEAWRTVGRRGLLSYLAPDRAFWEEEIAVVLQGGGIGSLEEYLAAPRTGRRHRLGPDARRAVWALHEATAAALRRHEVHTLGDVILLAEGELRRAPEAEPYRAVVVDDAQDLSLAMLRMVRLLVPERPDDLTLLTADRPPLHLGAAGPAAAGITGQDLRLTRAHRPAPATVVERTVGRADRATRLVARLRELRAAGGGSTAVLTATHDGARRATALLEADGIGVTALETYDGAPGEGVLVGTVRRAVGLDVGHVLLPEVPGALLDGAPPPEDDLAHERWDLARRELAVARARARDGVWIGVVGP